MSEPASEKLYYKIGEVAEILKINTSVLRFWETQFELLKPQKTRSGQRLYSRRELELARQIHQLLYKEKLTIAGAKARITPARKITSEKKMEILEVVKRELKELRSILD